MKAGLIILLTVVCMSEITFSENKIKIEVVSHGEPVIGANISLLTCDSVLEQSTITNLNGDAIIVLDDSTHLNQKVLQVKYIGFKSQSISLTENSSQPLKVDLIAESTQQNDSDSEGDGPDFEFIPLEKTEHEAELIPLK